MQDISVSLKWAIETVISQNPEYFYCINRAVDIDEENDQVIPVYGSNNQPLVEGNTNSFKYLPPWRGNPKYGESVLDLYLTDIFTTAKGWLTIDQILKFFEL